MGEPFAWLAIMDTKLSEHFSFNELTDSSSHPCMVSRNRDAALSHFGSLKQLSALLEEIRLFAGPMLIDSGFRFPELNALVKGSPTSQHLVGEAADFVPMNKSLNEVFEWIKASRLKWGQLILEPGWIHISLPTDKHHNEVFDFSKK